MKLWLLMFILILCLCPVIAVTYSGDSVYIDDSNAFINVTPHTRIGSGYVEVELLSKVYTGNVSVAFGVDDSDMVPKRLEFYNPHYETVTQSYTCFSEFNYTVNPNYFWCSENGTVIFEGHFTSGDIQEATAYWEEERLVSWSRVQRSVKKVNYTYDSMTEWYYMDDVPVSQGIARKARFYLNVNIDSEINNKYDFAFWPSDKSISQSVEAGQFYFIDPYTQPGGIDVNKILILYEFESDVCTDYMGFSNCTNTGVVLNDTTNFYYTGSQGAGFGASSGASANSRVVIDPLGEGVAAMSFWFRSSDSSTGQYLLTDQDNADPQPTANKGADNTLKVTLNNNVLGYYTGSDCTFPDDDWIHVIFNAEDDETAVYINGSQCGISSTGSGTTLLTTDFNFGDHSNTNDQYTTDAFIDQLVIFNESLNSSEISWLFNDGDAQYPLVSDTPPNTEPEVNITAPDNGSIIQAPYNITFTISDDENDTLEGNLSYYDNGVLQAVLANLTNGSDSFYLDYNLSEGTYNLTLNMCENDTSDLYCVNDTIQFTFDINYPPEANITAPANGATITSPYLINYSINDDDNDNLTGNLSLYQGGALYDVLMNVTQDSTEYNLSYNLTVGTYVLSLLICENDTLDLYCDEYNITFYYDDGSSPNLNCYLNTEPYYFVNGFPVLCKGVDKYYSCIGYLSYNEKVIQTIPEQKVLEQGDVYTHYIVEDYNVLLQFGRHNLRDAEPVNLSVMCWTNTSSMYFNETITPYLAEPYIFDSVLSWSVRNTVGITTVIVGIVLLIIVGCLIYAYWHY